MSSMQRTGEWVNTALNTALTIPNADNTKGDIFYKRLLGQQMQFNQIKYLFCIMLNYQVL